MVTELDNSECRLGISGLYASLICNISIRSSDGRATSRSFTASSLSLPGIAAGEKRVGAQAFVTQLQLTNKSNPSEPLQPSTSGKIITCQYTLQIAAGLEGCICCSSTPVVSIPISIVQPPVQGFGAVQAPPNWNPKTAPLTQIYFSDSSRYPEKPKPIPVQQQPKINTI